MNRLAIFVFFMVAALAPYVSAKDASLAFVQNPEEKVESTEVFEETLSHQSITTTLVFTTDISELSYPVYIPMTSQQLVDDFHKPPLC